MEYNRSLWFVFLLLGCGQMTATQAFFSASDYFIYMLPKYKIMFFIPCFIALPLFPSSYAMIFLGSRFKALNRLYLHYLVAALCIGLVPLSLINRNFVGMIICFILSFICGFCSVILQSTLFGLGSELGPPYIIAANTGTVVIGIVTCLMRILSKVIFKNIQYGGYFYFLFMTCYLLICTGLCYINRHHLIIKYNPEANVEMTMSNTQTNAPLLDNNSNDQVDNVTVSSIENNHSIQADTIGDLSDNNVIIGKKVSKAKVFGKIKYDVINLALSFSFHCLLIPALITDTKNDGTIPHLTDSWWIILILLINFIFDVLGRIITFYWILPTKWNTVVNIIRLPLFVVFILCRNGTLNNIVCMINTAVWCLSTGVTVNSAIAAAPPKVELEEKEIEGFIMTTALFVGIVSGSIGGGIVGLFL